MEQKVNPIVVEIIRNGLNSVAREMNACLIRSAFSPGIYEMKDCSVGIFDKNAQLLGQSSGLPIFLGNLEICIQLVTDKIGIEAYKEGDVYIMNDPYLQGTHASDVTVFAPVFYKGKLEGFTATRAAMSDIGGKDPVGSSDFEDVYQEGLRIPPIKLVDGGVFCEDVMSLIEINSRYHREMRGDLKAQIAACYTGEKRMIELCDRYGAGTLHEAAQEIFKQAEKLDRQAVAQIPDGVYTAEGTLDNAGNDDEEKPVKVAVTIEGDQMTIDLSGSSKMAGGPVNCGEAQTIAACRVAYKELIHPESQVSGGNFRNLEVKVPKGSIFAAEEPAPCGWYFSSLGLLIDLVVKALAPVMPDRAAAAHYGDSMVILFSGRKPWDGEMFSFSEATVGGWGAFQGGDGQNCMVNVVNGDLRNWSIEFIENKYPLKIHTYQVRQDSEGAGEYRGGLGVRRIYEILGDECYVTLWLERSKTPAWGLFGGEQALGPVVIINRGTKEEQRYRKVNRLKLKKGDLVELCTGGGGGFGKPGDRDKSRVKDDLESGYISEKRAEETYGYR